MRDQIRAAFESAGLDRIVEAVVHLAQPSVRLRSIELEDDSVPISGSKLGGCPDLMPETEWPAWEGVPLAFVAQINLGEIPAPGELDLLPSAGLLSFFYDVDHRPMGYNPKLRGGWSVLYQDGDPTRAHRMPIPAELATRQSIWLPHGNRYAPCALSFKTETTLPPADSLHVERLALSEDEYRRYRGVLDSWSGDAFEPRHRLMGHPDAIQGDMQVESQLVSHGMYLGDGEYDVTQAAPLLEGISDWQLLLQLDTDPAARMLWGINGRIYFWIQRTALHARQFDNVWFIMQFS